MKVNKKLENARKLFDSKKIYSLTQALEIAKKTSYSKFEGTLDLILNLNLDVRKSDQQLRGSVLLPNGMGKKVKILAITDTPKTSKSLQELKVKTLSTADLDSFFKKDKLNFNAIIAEPSVMAKLSKFGRILGPKNLMPNPKTGTVSENLPKVAKEILKGKANYKTDKNGIIHTSFGKVSMPTKSLEENVRAILKEIKKVKPKAVKGTYIKNCTISATMGPGVKVALEK